MNNLILLDELIEENKQKDKRIAKLEAENKRYRESLEEIAEYYYCDEYIKCQQWENHWFKYKDYECPLIECWRCIAKQALKGAE